MDTALGLFRNECEVYPPSDANDSTGKPYCGAMKLAEALMGQDLLGFHSKSGFWRDGLDLDTRMPLYPLNPPEDNLKQRKGPYLAAESAMAWRLADIYGKGKTGPFPEDTYVLCDTYIHKRSGGKKTGMPILYYKADRFGTSHDANEPANPTNIYGYRDNQALINLGVPGDPKAAHPLADPKRFYLNTRNHLIKTASQPYRADSYILISAGPDGLYGTADDICNFNWKYHE
jgi:hypothetical protein